MGNGRQMNFQSREFAAAWWSWVHIREKDNLIEKQVISSFFFSYNRSYGFLKTWPQILLISSHHWSSLWSLPLNQSGSLWTEYSSGFGHLTPHGESTERETDAQGVCTVLVPAVGVFPVQASVVWVKTPSGWPQAQPPFHCNHMTDPKQKLPESCQLPYLNAKLTRSFKAPGWFELLELQGDFCLFICSLQCRCQMQMFVWHKMSRYTELLLWIRFFEHQGRYLKAFPCYF